MMLTRFRNIAYVLAYAVATIPLWHYITDGRILALMVAVVTFAYIDVVLSTVQAAQPILSSEKAKTPLPRWLPDKPKYQKWWLLVRHTLKWHLLLIPPKMGLALGFVQFFHAHWMDYEYSPNINFPQVLRSFFLSPYVYFSHGFQGFLPAYPQGQTVLIACIVLIIFSWAKCGFWSASVILTYSHRNLSVMKLGVLLFLRYSAIIFGIIGFLFFFISTYRVQPLNVCYLNGANCQPNEWDEQREAAQIRYRRNLRIGETVHTAIFTLVEDGVLLGANVMRPVEHTAFARTMPGYDYIQDFDNRPFVARQIVAGLLGLLLYAGATWLVMWFVEDET